MAGRSLLGESALGVEEEPRVVDEPGVGGATQRYGIADAFRRVSIF